jgi:subtilisin family serine protease
MLVATVLFVLVLGLPLPALAAQPADPPAPTPPAGDSVPSEVLIQWKAGVTDAGKARARSRAGAVRQEVVVASRLTGKGELELAKLPPGQAIANAVRGLQADPAVDFAERNWTYYHQATSNDPKYTDGSLWGMYGDATSPANQYGSQAGEAWATGHTGSRSVYVGVIDEGIQFEHPDLKANVWTNLFDVADGVDNDGNGYVDDVHGWDFDGRDNSIYDGGTRGNLDNHGTHVAGTIGAESNGSGVVGMNWNVTLISAKFLGRRGGTTANAIKAVDYITDLKTRHGLNIVATNNSWGGGGFSQGLSDAIGRANSANILFIAAAGNSGTNNDATASYPANYQLPNVIAVAAIDRDGKLASFSQYGATKVHLGAPGVSVFSTTAYNTYSSYSGTSMATPHVTGAAALYASTHPGAAAAAIKTHILSSAVQTPSLVGKTVTGGRLNVSGF